MRRVLQNIVWITALVGWTACSKKDNATASTPDTTPPVITITTPASNQSIAAGQTINVNAAATDNNKVTELHIHVTNKTTGAILRDIHSYPGKQSGTVQDAFTAAAGLTYTIRIIALDPAQNLATAQVEVFVN